MTANELIAGLKPDTTEQDERENKPVVATAEIKPVEQPKISRSQSALDKANALLAKVENVKESQRQARRARTKRVIEKTDALLKKVGAANTKPTTESLSDFWFGQDRAELWRKQNGI